MADTSSTRPVLSDAVLRETLDLMGTVIAQMAGKLDKQGQNLTAIHQMALESRDAALEAKAYADPKLYAKYIGEEVYEALGQSLEHLENLRSDFVSDQKTARHTLDELTRQEELTLHRLRDELASVERWKRRLPFMALFGLVLVLGLSIGLPRFLAANTTACTILGGQWLRENTTDRFACVFYAK